MGILDTISDIFGGEPELDVSQHSLLDPASQKLLQASSDFLEPRIGTGATPLPFDQFAQPGDLFERAFSQFSESFGEGGDSEFIRSQLRNLISGSGTFQPDIGRVSREFGEQITTPTARILRETLGLDIQNQLNQPGRLFASDVREKVGRGITQELGRSTLPLLAGAIENERGRGFASSEAALNRQLPALAALQSEPITSFQQAFGVAESERGLRQQELSARASEFLRLSPEADPFLQLALGFAVTPTTENIGFQTPDRFGQFLGAASAAAGAAAGA